MKKLLSAIPAIALLAISLASCSKNAEEILETVPANAYFVADIDMPEVLKGLGADVSESEIKLPDGWSFLASTLEPQAFGKINDFCKAFDTEHFILFDDEFRKNSVVTLRITDSNALQSLINGLKSEKASGYSIVKFGGATSLVFKGNQAWILKSENPVATIEDILAQAREANMAQMEGITRFLERDGCASLVSNIQSIGNANQWACLGIVVRENKLVFNAQIMEPDGKVIDINGLQPLQTDFLRYIPAGMNLVAAAGVTPQTDWSFIEKTIETSGVDQLAGLMETLLPYLRATDGTAAVATTVNTDDFAASGHQFLMMLHLQQERINGALNEIEQQIAAAGGKPVRSADGTISASVPGASLYAANLDGYLAIATFPLSPDQNNELAPYFVNREAGIYVNLPSIPFLPGNPGMKIDLQVQKSSASMIIESNQPLGTLLASLLRMAL